MYKLLKPTLDKFDIDSIKSENFPINQFKSSTYKKKMLSQYQICITRLESNKYVMYNTSHFGCPRDMVYATTKTSTSAGGGR